MGENDNVVDYSNTKEYRHAIKFLENVGYCENTGRCDKILYNKKAIALLRLKRGLEKKY